VQNISTSGTHFTMSVVVAHIVGYQY